MRYLLTLVLCALLSIQTTQAIVMTSTGLETPQGKIQWEQLINLPDQVQNIRNVAYVTSAIVLSYIAYKIWQERTAKKQNDISEMIDSSASNPASEESKI
jgi:hypothetical protein